MALTEHLAMLITANGAQAMATFDQLGSKAERELGKAEKGSAKMAAGLTNAGVKMVGASAIIGAGMWKAGQASANLEASISTTESVFGSAAKTIDEFGKTSANSVGLSNRAFHEQTALIGSFAKNMGFTKGEAAGMSVELVKVASDMGAAFNKTPEEAIQAIGAAFRGETDPIEQFGVSIKEADIKAQVASMGLDMSTTAAQKHSKALAIQALILKQTADISGQFGRESDTLAGKQARAAAASEDAAARLGKGFTPVMEKVTDALTNGANKFSEFDDSVGGSASTVLAWTTVGVGAVGVAAMIAGQAIKMKESFVAAGVAIKGASASTMAGMAGMTVAITAGILAIQKMKSDSDEFSTGAFKGVDFTNLQAANAELQRSGAALDAAGRKWDAYSAGEKLAHLTEYKDLRDAGEQRREHNKHLEASVTVMNNVAAASKVAGGDVRFMVQALKLDPTAMDMSKLIAGAKAFKASGGDLAITMKAIESAAPGADAAVGEFGGTAAEVAKKVDNLRGAFTGVRDAQDGYAKAQQSVVDAQNAVGDATRGVRDAQQSYQDSLRAIGTAQQSYRDSVDSVVDAERSRIESLHNVEEAQRGVADAERRVAEVFNGGANGNDYALSLAEARLRQREATNNLSDAEKKLGEAKTPDEKVKAQLAIERAQIEVKRAANELKATEAQQAKDLSSAIDQVGVAHDRVVQAEMAAQKSADAVTVAQRGVQKASEDVARAQRDAQKAAEGVSTAHVAQVKAVNAVRDAQYDAFKSFDTMVSKLDAQKKALLENKGASEDLINRWLIMAQLAPQLAPVILPMVDAVRAGTAGSTPAPAPSAPHTFDQGASALGGSSASVGAQSITVVSNLHLDGKQVAQVVEPHLVNNARGRR